MARHLLSPREVQTTAVGDHSDGDGLFLRVQPGANGALRASWVLRYTSPARKRRELGLGGVERACIEAAGKSLKRARQKADEARSLLDKGIDPIDTKRSVRDQEPKNQQVGGYSHVGRNHRRFAASGARRIRPAPRLIRAASLVCL